MAENCSVCHVLLRNTKGRPRKYTVEMAVFFKDQNRREEGALICLTCYKKYYHKTYGTEQKNDQELNQGDENQESKRRKSEEGTSREPTSSTLIQPEESSTESTGNIKTEKCSVCNHWFRNVKGRPSKLTHEIVSYFLSQDIKTSDESFACHKCYMKYYNSKKSEQMVQVHSETETREEADKPAEELVLSSQEVSFSQSSTSEHGSQQSGSETDPSVHFLLPKEKKEEPFIEKDIPRAISTHSRCMVCRVTDFQQKKIQVVNDYIRTYCFTKKNLYIPKGNRICEEHVRNNIILNDSFERIQIASDVSFIPVFDFEIFLKEILRNRDSFFDRLACLQLSEKEFQDLIGLSKESFVVLADPLELRDSRQIKSETGRNKYQALGVFLSRLRSNMSQTLLAHMFGLQSQPLISSYCSQVLDAFLPIINNKLGVRNVSKEDIINNKTSKIAKQFFGEDRLILVIDGTYSYTQKSNNFWFQRTSYSTQKKKNLVKPLTVCTTTGYIIDFFGPYPAIWNDADILKDLLKDNDFRNFIRGSTLIVDRGFRDVVEDLKKLNISVKMPSLKGKRKQFTLEEANSSRLVTKVRWVVEAVHGIIKKKFKYLDSIRKTVEVPQIGRYFRIAALIQNQFRKPLCSDKDDTKLANKMMQLANKQNEVWQYVEENNLIRRTINFKNLKIDDLSEFPVLIKEELREYFTGSYQLKLVSSYLAEFLGKHTITEILVHKIERGLLKVKMPSRHCKNKEYTL